MIAANIFYYYSLSVECVKRVLYATCNPLPIGGDLKSPVTLFMENDAVASQLFN